MVPTSPSRELSLPLAAPLAAQLLAILVPAPDQQLTARPDDPAGSVENLPVVLKGHQVLLFIIPGAVHIPGIEADEGKQKHSDEFSLPEKPFPDHLPHRTVPSSKAKSMSSSSLTLAALRLWCRSQPLLLPGTFCSESEVCQRVM